MNHFNKVEVWSVFDVVLPSMVRLGLNYNISLRSWIFHTLEGEEPQIKKMIIFNILHLCIRTAQLNNHFEDCSWLINNNSVQQITNKEKEKKSELQQYCTIFNSHEWPTQNFSLQYQYNIHQISYENREKYKFGN